MYYEEKWIDGKLCYRHTPDGDFVEYTIISYRNALWELQQQVKPVDLAYVRGNEVALCRCGQPISVTECDDCLDNRIISDLES